MKDLLFGVHGRVNRAKFWLVALGIFVLEVIIFAAVGGSTAMSADPQQAMANLGPVAGIVLFVFGVVALWISIAVAIKR